MRANTNYFVVLLLMLAGIGAGCSERGFRVGTEHRVSVYNYSALSSVSHNTYSFSLRDTALVVVTSPTVTQYYFESFIRLDSGSGFKVYLRPVAEHVVRDSGYTLTMSKHGFELDSGRTVLARLPYTSFATDSLTRFTIYNDNRFVQVTLGCDTLFHNFLALKESDALAIRPLEGSKVTFYDPIWHDMSENRQ